MFVMYLYYNFAILIIRISFIIILFNYKFISSILYIYIYIIHIFSGNLVTSRGPATAVEFGLSLVEVLVGKEEKVKVAKGILYPL